MFPVIDFPFPFAGFQSWIQSFLPPKEVQPPPIPEPVVEEPPSNPESFHLGACLTTGKRFLVNRDSYKDNGERIAILASSGMGKSYVGGVLMESWLDMGTPVIIIDPEGEAHTLADKYPVIIYGGEHQTKEVALDIPTAKDEDIQTLVETIIEEGLSVIFDFSEWDDGYTIFSRLTEILFETMSKERFKRRLNLVVEEAHIFGPQHLEEKGQTECLKALIKIAKRGRKRGLGLMVMTQRPASLAKNILSQSNIFMFGPMTSAIDANAISKELKQSGIRPEDVMALKPGQFYYSDRNGSTLINVKKRKCAHGGATPDQQQKDWKVVRSKKDAAAIAARIGRNDL